MKIEDLEDVKSEDYFVRTVCLDGFKTREDLEAWFTSVEEWCSKNKFSMMFQRIIGESGKLNVGRLAFKKIHEKRYCKDCKHFFEAKDGPLCAATRVIGGNLITGEDTMQTCQNMRFSTFQPSPCGEEGKRFEPKEGSLNL